MGQPAEVVAYHGWGFDASCWVDWGKRFAAESIPFAAFDRGYFGAAHCPSISGDRPSILFVHSFGLHLCPVDQLQQADVLVVFGSFVEFHPQEARERRRSQRVVQRMMQECQQQPEQVLRAFWQNCGYPVQGSPPTVADHNTFMHDLQQLNVAQFNLQLLQPIPQILVLHGTDDQIVAPERGKALADSLPNAEYIEFEGEGHALPFTHIDECWGVVCSLLSAVSMRSQR